MKKLFISILLVLICASQAVAFGGILAGIMGAGTSGGGSGSAYYTDNFSAISGYWSTLTGSYALSSNGYYAVGTQAGERSYNLYNRTISANQYLAVTLQSGSMPMYNSAIGVRCSLDGHRYEALSDGSSIYLRKCTALSTCSNLTSATLDVPSSATVKLSIDSNNTLTFYSNNTSIVSYTDSSSPITDGFPVVGPYGQNAELHNAEIGDL